MLIFRKILCNFHHLKPYYLEEYDTYMIGRNFPYKNQFRIFISKMRTAAVLLKNKETNYQITKTENDGILEVRFNHILIISLIWITGFMISQILLFFEVFLKFI